MRAIIGEAVDALRKELRSEINDALDSKTSKASVATALKTKANREDVETMMQTHADRLHASLSAKGEHARYAAVDVQLLTCGGVCVCALLTWCAQRTWTPSPLPSA